MILSDRDIKALVNTGELGIAPFIPHKMDDGKFPSFGLEPFGYTLRFQESDDDKYWKRVTGWHLPTGQSKLFTTVETIKIPENCLGIIYGKSSYARQGIICNTTPFEPGWIGKPSLCLFNGGPNPIVFHDGYGICQLVLHWKDQKPETLYQGRYQNAKGIQESKIS